METPENGLIALRPATPASRPPSSEEELRQDLREAIDRQREADKRADAAKEAARRAEGHRLEARRYVDEFREAHAAKVREEREAHAHAISEAIRAGRTVPGTPPRSCHRLGCPGGRTRPVRRLLAVGSARDGPGGGESANEPPSENAPRGRVESNPGRQAPPERRT